MPDQIFSLCHASFGRIGLAAPAHPGSSANAHETLSAWLQGWRCEVAVAHPSICVHAWLRVASKAVQACQVAAAAAQFPADDVVRVILLRHGLGNQLPHICGPT